MDPPDKVGLFSEQPRTEWGKSVGTRRYCIGCYRCSKFLPHSRQAGRSRRLRRYCKYFGKRRQYNVEVPSNKFPDYYSRKQRTSPSMSFGKCRRHKVEVPGNNFPLGR